MQMTPAALGALLGGDMENFIAAATPGGIEAQEKAGQIEQSFLETLPREGTLVGQWGRRDNYLEEWERLGFVFNESGGDDLFIEAKFPQGWRKQATDHAMWSHLLDDKGRKRASIFYKAAFYDRKAHIHFERRYSASAYAEIAGDTENYACVVRDGDAVIRDFGKRPIKDYDASKALEAKAREWLDKHDTGNTMTHYCVIHKRVATHTHNGRPCCDPSLGGITMPCQMEEFEAAIKELQAALAECADDLRGEGMHPPTRALELLGKMALDARP